MGQGVHCWCGGTEFSAFSPDYGRCGACGTLVSLTVPPDDLDHVTESEEGLYGRDYWFTHQTEDYGHPTIVERARTDLSERCLWWLRTVVGFKLPPARVLEVGCAHGGAVALLKLAGFDASGVELSPWVVKFARGAFDVEVVQGTVEAHPWRPGSFDVIALFDVVEHLADPVRTIRRCVELLKPDGILVMQTPCVAPDASFERLSAESGALMRALVPAEHLFLFTEESFRKFLADVGCDHVALVPAVFPDVDMSFVASPSPLQPNSDEAVAAALSRHPHGRFVQAFLDLYQRGEGLERAARDAASKAVTLEGEKLTLQHEKHLLGNEVLTLQGYKEALESERQTLQSDRQTLLTQLQERYEEIRLLFNDKQTLLTQMEARYADIQSLQTQLEARYAEIQSLQARIAHLTIQRDAFLNSRLGRLQTFQARIRARVRRAFGVEQP